MSSFGISNEASLPPFVYGLEYILSFDSHTIIREDFENLRLRLWNGDIDGAFITSMEFARHGRYFQIIPGFALSFKGSAGQAVLFFRPEKQQLDNVAYATSSSTFLSLMRVIFWEKYGIRPQFVEEPPDISRMLEHADGVFFDGETAAEHVEQFPQHVDFINEWTDLTGLPFVFSFCVGVPEKIKQKSISQVIPLAEGVESWLKKIDSKTLLPGQYESHNNRCRIQPEHCLFRLTDTVMEGLSEFYRLAFYHGMLPGIPDISVYSPSSSKGKNT